MYYTSSSLISTPGLRSDMDAGLLTDSTTIVRPFHAYPMTTSQMTNATSQENPLIKTKQTQLYKTEYCRNWAELGECRYAHGDSELREVARHSRYKTQICRTYHTEGTCLYGNRCTFIHDYKGMTRTINDGNKLLVGSSSLVDNDGGGGEDNQILKDGLASDASGKVRQHSRFFSKNSANKDHQVPSIHSSPPHLSTTAAVTTTKFQNNGVWNSKLGFGSPQPFACTKNLVCQHGLTTSPVLTATPTNTMIADDSHAPALHQVYETSRRPCSLPASLNSSMHSNSYPVAMYATPPHVSNNHQHYSNASTKLDSAITDHLASLKIEGDHRGSYSSYLASSSSLKPTPFFII